jgi:hypothetical protein
MIVAQRMTEINDPMVQIQIRIQSITTKLKEPHSRSLTHVILLDIDGTPPVRRLRSSSLAGKGQSPIT